MRIYRILNNNVVIILDKNNQEQIVCGKGLAFNKKNGDEIEESKINKVFTLTNNDLNKKFQQLLLDIPLDYVQLSDAIIEYIKVNLGKKLSDTIFISLCDHIYTSVNRYYEGIVMRNAMLWDIKRFYEQEYEMGIAALKMINEKLKIDLPEDEAGFIALHIVNAEMDELSMKQIYDITKIIREITNIVRFYFKIEFNEKSVYYYRFVSHVKFFAQRLASGRSFDEPGENDLLDIIKAKYAHAYGCVKELETFIARNYDYTITSEEKLYLTIHIARVVEKNEESY